MGYFVGCFGIFLIFLNIWDIMGYCGNFGWYFGKTANVSAKSYKHEQVTWLDESWVETDIESQILCISSFAVLSISSAFHLYLIYLGTMTGQLFQFKPFLYKSIRQTQDSICKFQGQIPFCILMNTCISINAYIYIYTSVSLSIYIIYHHH